MKFIKAIVFIFIQAACFGQSTATVSFSLYLADIATIAVVPANSTINLVGSASSIAGNELTFTSNNNLWINFTSQVSSGNLRNITAQITSGSLPSGTSLKLTITGPSGTGAGLPGNIVSPQTLSNSQPQKIIVSGIGNATTGTGVNNGYNIKLELVITDFSLLKSGNTSISITFTIT
jgi:hypothetical protein